MRFTTKRTILNVLAVIFALAFIFLHKFLTKTFFGITVLVMFLIIYFILTLKWWRCPHCNTYLWRLPPFSTHCPHCSNELK